MWTIRIRSVEMAPFGASDACSLYSCYARTVPRQSKAQSLPPTLSPVSLPCSTAGYRDDYGCVQDPTVDRKIGASGPALNVKVRLGLKAS